MQVLLLSYDFINSKDVDYEEVGKVIKNLPDKKGNARKILYNVWYLSTDKSVEDIFEGFVESVCELESVKGSSLYVVVHSLTETSGVIRFAKESDIKWVKKKFKTCDVHLANFE